MDSHRVRTIGNYFESYTPTTGGGAGDDDHGLMLSMTDEMVAMATQPGASMPRPSARWC